MKFTKSGKLKNAGDANPDTEPATLDDLQRIARNGSPKDEPVLCADRETFEAMLRLMKLVAMVDGALTEQEMGIIERFIKNHLPLQEVETLASQLMQYVNNLSLEDVHAKNDSHLLSQRTNPQFLGQFYGELYHLAFSDDMTIDERRLVDRIGQWLEFKPRFIRVTALEARQAWLKDLNVSEMAK